MQRLNAWVGTALKSSQPSRSASRRSGRLILQMTGSEVEFSAGLTSGAASSEYCAAMVAISLGAADLRGTVSRSDHDQARPEANQPAMSRTEPQAYSDLPMLSLGVLGFSPREG